MAAIASDWLRHFRLPLWNGWTEFNETWQEGRPQRPLPSLCFSGRSEKQDGCPGLWLAETNSTSLQKLLRNSTKLDRKQDLNVLYQVCVFRADRKKKMAALASDGLRYFQLLFETVEQNSMKLDRKRDLNILYHVCIFRANRKNKMAALADSSKRLHIVLRCTIYGPLGLLFILVMPPKGRGRDKRTRKKCCWAGGPISI